MAVRRLAALAIPVCAMLFAPLTAGAALSQVPSASGPGSGSATAPVGKVQARLLTPGQRHQSSGHESPPFRTKNPAALRAAKLKAGGAPPGGTASPKAAAPNAAALFNGLNSPGLSAADEGFQPTPPDSTGAIGPTRYVEMVNQLVGVYDRGNLTLVSSTDLGTFTGTPSSLATSDPQVQWDAQGNRWLYGAVAFNSNLTNTYLLFGWSKTADPTDLTGGWCRYASPTGANIPDYPKLGHDANFVIFGTNIYDGSNASLPFVTANITAIPKPAGQSNCSGSVTVTNFADATHVLNNADGTTAFTPVPANTTDASANGYIVAAHDVSVTPQSKVMVWHMTPGPLLVANGDISVGSSYTVPPNVPQPGTTYLIDSLDGRLTQAVANFDPSAGTEAVWTQHTVGGSGRSIVRWYELLPGSLTIRQQGQLANATDFYWNAAISPSSAGDDAMISYNRGSSSLLPVIGAQTRTKSTPPGQMDAGEVLLGSSSAADQEVLFQGNCTSSPCRWGDYSGATPDPINPGVIWGSNQLSGPAFFGFAQWTTQNYAITTNGTPPTAPAPPTGVNASAVDTSHITISWTASAGATSYKVQRSPDGSSGWAQVGTSSATRFTDSGLTPSTTYFYRVIAGNSIGDSAPSTVASATTGTAVAYSQSPQGNWTDAYGADGYALLNWNGGTDLVSLPQSRLVFDQGGRYLWSSGTTAVQALQSPDASTRHAACFSDGNQIRLHLSFTTAYSGTIHIYVVDWDAIGRRETITVNDGSGPQTANITTDFSQGAWVNVPINVAAGGNVTVTVARTAGINAVASGIFLGGAAAAPAPPTGLSASAVNASQIGLSWTASSGATSYKIQRSPDGSTAWTQVGTSGTTTFTDSGLIPSTTYFYRVLASNGPGNSAPSNVASATTLAGLAYSQSPQGNWTGSYGADGYALLNWNGGSDLVSLPQSSLVFDQCQLLDRVQRDHPYICRGLGRYRPAGDHNRQRRLGSPDRQHHDRLLAGRLGQRPDQRCRRRQRDGERDSDRRNERCGVWNLPRRRTASPGPADRPERERGQRISDPPQLDGHCRSHFLQDPAFTRRQHRLDPGRHQQHHHLHRLRAHPFDYLLLSGAGQQRNGHLCPLQRGFRDDLGRPLLQPVAPGKLGGRLRRRRLRPAGLEWRRSGFDAQMQPGRRSGQSLCLEQCHGGSGLAEPGHLDTRGRHHLRCQPGPHPPHFLDRVHRHHPSLCPRRRWPGSAGDHHRR
ncbi:MAG: fibronectin type III domain-containing protein [Chloroflexi bacterium]|nr:MAG: fibronectin type III domain-containing protein [Chloroflexota bacterium]